MRIPIVGDRIKYKYLHQYSYKIVVGEGFQTRPYVDRKTIVCNANSPKASFGVTERQVDWIEWEETDDGLVGTHKVSLLKNLIPPKEILEDFWRVQEISEPKIEYWKYDGNTYTIYDVLATHSGIKWQFKIRIPQRQSFYSTPVDQEININHLEFADDFDFNLKGMLNGT